MLLGPAKMPKSVVNSLHREFDKALRMPELQEKLKQSGVDVINQGPEQATAYLDKMARTWADIIKASGTKIE
jgi:tripartite-type tricarboxylate transporter receptor subunit TctC